MIVQLLPRLERLIARRVRRACALLVAPLLGGCGVASFDYSPGHVQLYVTDAPAALESVHLVLAGVALHIVTSDSASGWITLRSDTAGFQLLALAGGTLAPLAASDLPIGLFDAVRVKLSPLSTVTDSGVTHPLVISDSAQAGIVRPLSFELTPRSTVNAALDFDAAASVRRLGDGTWVMEPVMRAVVLSSTPSPGTRARLPTAAAVSRAPGRTTGR